MVLHRRTRSLVWWILRKTSQRSERHIKKRHKFNLVTFEELRTLVTEVESVLNSRPLCYVSDEVEQVLTPSHFLILKRHGKESKRSIPEINILAKYKGSRRMIERFWDTWYKQYLTALRERMVAKRNKCSKTTPKRGDIVLLKDSKPRLQWKFGIVETARGTRRNGSVRFGANSEEWCRSTKTAAKTSESIGAFRIDNSVCVNKSGGVS